MLQKQKNRLKKLLERVTRDTVSITEKKLLVSGQILSNQNNQRSQIKSLTDVEFSIFSQWGEDGILSWLVHQFKGIPQTFIEFGVQDYQESNTRYLMMFQNWHGLIIDGSSQNIRDIQSKDYFWKHDLAAVAQFITAENVNSIFTSSGFSGDIGILSIDIDGNDYWIWEKIEAVKPKIVVAEYNAVFGDIERLSVPYRADFVRSNAHYSNLYFGASLPALISLGRSKGYEFVGTNSSGVNAFFVQRDGFDHIAEKIEERRAYPSKHRESRNRDGLLTFASGMDRLKQIEHESVVDLATGDMGALNKFEEIYSEEWANGSWRKL